MECRIRHKSQRGTEQETKTILVLRVNVVRLSLPLELQGSELQLLVVSSDLRRDQSGHWIVICIVAMGSVARLVLMPLCPLGMPSGSPTITFPVVSTNLPYNVPESQDLSGNPSCSRR